MHPSTRREIHLNYLKNRTLQHILADRFPWTFAGEGQPKKPLAIGIITELRAACPSTPKYRLKSFLKFYTNKPSYLEAVRAGEARVDLAGNVIALPTPGEVAYSDLRLKQREERRRQAKASSEVLVWGKKSPDDDGGPAAPAIVAGSSDDLLIGALELRDTVQSVVDSNPARDCMGVAA